MSSSVSLLLCTAIAGLRKSANKCRVKIDRHVSRMGRLEAQMSFETEAADKLNAWLPYMQSEEKLDFLLETICRGNIAEVSRAKELMQNSLTAFKNAEISSVDLLNVFEGDDGLKFQLM